ncbi:response regulator [bacterium]|nr:response regulator [bacterium]
MAAFTALDMIYTEAWVPPDISVEKILNIFRESNFKFLPIVRSDGRPSGMIAKDRLMNMLSTKYGYAVYQNRKIIEVMDRDFLCLDSSVDISEIVERSMKRDAETIYDDIIIIEAGRYRGMISIKNLITTQMENILYKNKHIDLQNQFLKEAHYQVERTETKYQILFENDVHAVAVIEVNGVISKINNRFTQITGYTKEAIEGKKHFLDLIHTDDKKNLVAMFLSAQKDSSLRAATDEPSGGLVWEVNFLTQSGEKKVGEITAKHVEQTQQILCSIHDITEKKRYEEQLRQSEKLSAVGSMLTGITHELNNQLTPIVAYLDLLLQEPSLNEKFLNRLNVVHRSASTASSIVNTLLRFAKPKPLYLRESNLNKLVRDNLMLLKYHEAYRGVQVQLFENPELPSCRIDENQIGQVILNILINGVQAVDGKEGKLTIRTDFDKEYVSVSVHDNGIGISSTYIKKIFEPFFTTKTPDKGTGLGLSISYSIIKAHDGEIDVVSEEGVGSTFTIRLPIRRPVALTTDEPRKFASPKAGKKNSILVIEDDPSIREMSFELLLEYFECEVLLADNGKKGIEMIANHNQFDLIISDIRMPECDGFQLYSWIESNRSDLLNKIVFITGDTYDRRTRDFTETKRIELLFKPFKLDDLLNTVSKKIENKRPVIS